MKRLRILVLLHEEFLPPDDIRGLSDQEIHPWKAEYDVLRTLEELGHEVRPLPLGDELAPIRFYAQEWKPHVIFNLLRDFHGIGIYDAHIISLLELLRLPYTGCNPRGLLLATDKALSKKILGWHRIPVPAFAFFRRGQAVRPRKKLPWPMIVKSAVEHASLGITQASIVHDPEGLIERVHYVHERIGTDAIAEEYIEGRELTVGILGNLRLQAFPVWELTFQKLPPGSAPIVTERVKSDLDYQEKLGVRSRRARDLEPALEEQARRIARRAFRALSMSGYGRVDMRLGADGRLRVLEANPNPDLCFGEDLAESAEAAGLPYPALIQRILNLGLRYSPPWKAQGS